MCVCVCVCVCIVALSVCVVCGVQNRQKMKELRAREAKALSEEDYELGTYIHTYMYMCVFPLHCVETACIVCL